MENFGPKPPDPGLPPQPENPDWPEDPLGPLDIPEDFVPWGSQDIRPHIPKQALEMFDRFDYDPWSTVLERPKTPRALNKWRMPRLPKSVEQLFASYGFDTRKDMSYDPNMYQDYDTWTDPLIALSIMTGIKPEQLVNLVPIAELMQGSGERNAHDLAGQVFSNEMLLSGQTPESVYSGTDRMAAVLDALHFHLGTTGQMTPERPDIAVDLDPSLKWSYLTEDAAYKAAVAQGLDVSQYKDFMSIYRRYVDMSIAGASAGATPSGEFEENLGYLEQQVMRAAMDMLTNQAFDYLSPEGMNMLGQRPGWVDTGHPEDSIGNPANWLPSSILLPGKTIPADDPYWDTWGDYTQKHGFEQFNPLDQIEDWAPIVPRRTPPGNPRDAREWARQLGLTEHTAGMWHEGGPVGLGLKSNEVPAILTRGEMVLRPDQYHSGGIVGYAGGGPVMPSGLGGHQTTINIINKTPIQIEATEEFSMENFSQTIKNITIRAVQTDPNYRALMQGG